MVETGRKKSGTGGGKLQKSQVQKYAEMRTAKSSRDEEKSGRYGKNGELCGKMQENAGEDRKVRGNAIMRIYIRRNGDRVIPHPGLNGGIKDLTKLFFKQLLIFN